MENIYYILKCQRQTCGLRYPFVVAQLNSDRCPRCRGSTRLVLERTLEHEPWYGRAMQALPSSLDPFPLNHEPGSIRSFAFHALLDNIRSSWNVGSIFRTADGAGIDRIHLGGISPTPENSQVAKTALGAESSVAWDYSPDGLAKAEQLLAQSHRLWALEQHPQALSIGEVTLPEGERPLVLVVGNEVCGVDPGILELCEQILYIPMAGAKRSLNVAVAFGIAAFTLRTKIQPTPKPASDNSSANP